MASTSEKLLNIDLKYENFPPCHRLKLDLGGGVGSRCQRFVEVITSLHTLCAESGCIISGINEACGTGFPLVEVMVSYGSFEAKFLIEKSSVQIVGYYFEKEWHCFSDSIYKIDSTPRMDMDSAYKYLCCGKLGFRPMVDALYLMNMKCAYQRKNGCEIFFVHICGSVIFRPVQHQVFKGLISSEVQALFAPEDLLAYPNVHLPYVEYVDAFPNIGLLLKNWDKLSNVHVLFSITGEGYFDADSDSRLMEKLQISGMEFLKMCLGLLKKINFQELEMVLSEMDKKRETKQYVISAREAVKKLKDARASNIYSLRPISFFSF